MNDAMSQNMSDLLFKRFQLRGCDDAEACITCRVVGMKPQTSVLVLEIEGEEGYEFMTASDFNDRLVQRLD